LRRFKAGVFQVLGHPTRIHIVEILRKGEVSVGALLEEIGVEPANLSQHLTVLRSKGLVVNRKNGNQVLYSLRDPMLAGVLDTMKRYFQAHFQAAMSILSVMEQDA
jgi:ArsR family transcriptional regulator